MRALLALAIAPMLALTGCADDCYEQPATAHVGFVFEGSADELDAALDELGWDVSYVENALTFTLMRVTNGTTYRATVHYSGVERAGNVSISPIEGTLRGTSTVEESRVHLGPVVEPLVFRFGGEPEYGRGATHCGDV